MELLDLWVVQKEKKARWLGRSEAWRLKANTLKWGRRGGVVEARDGTLFSFEPPTVPVSGGERVE